MNPWQIRNLGYRVHQRWLVDHANFDISPGITALIGPNGAGKSTLMRLMSGILPRHSGTVEAPRDLTMARKKIGYVPQFPGIFHTLTVRQFLYRTRLWDPILHSDSSSSDKSLQDEIEHIIEYLDLSSLANKLGGQLGQTERRQVALATMWIRRVSLMLFDEPTAGLDPRERLTFWQQLSRFRQLPESPSHIMVSTHLLTEVESYTDAILLLEKGHITFSGQVPEFLALAQGHSFASNHDVDVYSIDSGRKQGKLRWILAEVPPSGAEPRSPDMLDAYLWFTRSPGGQLS